MEESQTPVGIADIRAHLNVLWRRKWLVIVTVFVITSTAFLATKFLSTSEYQSTTEIMRRQSGLDKVLLGSDFFQQTSQPDRDMQTASELVRSPEVVSEVQKSLGDELGGKNPVEMIDVTVVKQSDLLRIAATDTDPQLAADVANSFAASFINWRRQVDQSVLQQAREPIEIQVLNTPPEQQETAEYKLLRDRFETLKLLESVQTGNMEVVKPASVSYSPVSPRPLRMGIIAFLLSSTLGVGAAFFMEQFDNSIRDPEEVTKVLNKPILSVIPKTPSSSNGSLVTLTYPSGSSSEAYRLLKTNLSYIEPDSEIKSIMITSPEPSEGKSTSIANLAVTMARAGQRVIVLEADLRRPVLSSYFGLDNTFGLTNVITGNCSLRESLQVIEARDLAIAHDTDYDMHKGEENLYANSMNGIKPIYCATSCPIPP
ncbi:MAG: YveK family protein, partial [Thermoleophilia bacterium]